MKSPWRSPLYAILDLPQVAGVDLLEAGRGMLDGGCGVLQVRAKAGARSIDFDQLAQLAGLATAKGVPLIINDFSDLAVRLEAELGEVLIGLHFGQEDLVAFRDGAPSAAEPGGYWGLSTHNLEQLEATRRSTASYLGFGPVFSTSTKADADEVVGIELLARACRSSLHPIVGIGGIDGDRGASCLEAGAAAVACISALVGDSRVRIESRCAEVLATLMMH